MYSLALVFAIHTFSAFSAKTFLDWDYEKETSNIVTILEKDVLAARTPKPITLAISWPFEPTINFYRRTRNMTWMNEVTRDGPAIIADYYYIFREDITRVPLRGFPPVILFDDGKTMLVKVMATRLPTLLQVGAGQWN